VDTINIKQCDCHKEINKIIRGMDDLAMIVKPIDLICKEHNQIPQKLTINLVFDMENNART